MYCWSWPGRCRALSTSRRARFADGCEPYRTAPIVISCRSRHAPRGQAVHDGVLAQHEFRGSPRTCCCDWKRNMTARSSMRAHGAGSLTGFSRIPGTLVLRPGRGTFRTSGPGIGRRTAPSPWEAGIFSPVQSASHRAPRNSVGALCTPGSDQRCPACALPLMADRNTIGAVRLRFAAIRETARRLVDKALHLRANSTVHFVSRPVRPLLQSPAAAPGMTLDHTIHKVSQVALVGRHCGAAPAASNWFSNCRGQTSIILPTSDKSNSRARL